MMAIRASREPMAAIDMAALITSSLQLHLLRHADPAEDERLLDKCPRARRRSADLLTKPYASTAR